MKVSEIIAGTILITTILLLFILPIILWIIGYGKITTAENESLALYSALIGKTLSISIFSAFVAVILAYSMAILSSFGSKIIRNTFFLVVTIPLLIGFIARNYAWLGFFKYLTSGQNFYFKAIDVLLYNYSGVIIVMSTVFVPYAYFILLQGFKSIKIEYIYSAQLMGSSNKSVLLHVIHPIITRSFFIAFALITTLSVGYFITPQLIGGGNYDFIGNGIIKILSKIGDQGASVLAFYLFLTTLIPMILIIFFSIKRQTKLRIQ